MENKKLKTTDIRKVFKPLQFEWALEACEIQNKMHWLHTEIDLLQDVNEFHQTLSDNERNIVTNILRFFTQSDLEVGRAYIDYYLKIFKCPEIRMMLSTFAAMENIHVLAYSYLVTSLRLPDSEYGEFLKYQEMVNKYDYMQSFDPKDPESVALTLAVFSGFIEGMCLFSSFAILMYFSMRRARDKESTLRGLGQIVSFSIRDESLHCASVIKLFHTYVNENSNFINTDVLHSKIYEHYNILLKYEIDFIDLVFANGDLDGFTRQDVKEFITYLANLRLKQLGLKPLVHYEKNPVTWTDEFLHYSELTSFFDSMPTNYVVGDSIKDGEFDYESFLLNK